MRFTHSSSRKAAVIQQQLTKMSIPLRFAVLGAGSWGTALAIHLACCGYPTILWARNSQYANEMRASGENTRYLPKIDFPASLIIESDLKSALQHADIVFLATPSHGFEAILRAIKPFVKETQILLSITKGLTEHGGFMHQMAHTFLPNMRYALLSGPSFANEVARHMPTTVIVASDDQLCAQYLAEALSRNVFRVYTSNDLIGVQLGGAIKNVLAVAVGISDGLGFGANARAALVTRGLHEMKQLGLAAGAQEKTLIGLSGLGDLVLTCTDNQSRNRRLGLAIGQGRTLEQAQQEIGQVIESINTSAIMQLLIQRLQVEMPITEHVYQVLHHHLSPREAVKNLFSRSLKSE